MKKSIYNGENRHITIVTNFDTVRIPGKSSAIVEMEDDAIFNAPDGSFFVAEEGSWYGKTEHCATGADVEIYDADAE